ncbi:hypothetical protein C5167_001798 [Papaver somniferum]|uniref:Uncharacterized protein n=1 Tax=Papaver somniferum TaxID=3469 RepID=A0A4Y7KZW1_PAPSO|nr:hypothetical protein C5167_001798 [Papaver somniferum]
MSSSWISYCFLQQFFCSRNLELRISDLLCLNVSLDLHVFIVESCSHSVIFEVVRLMVPIEACTWYSSYLDENFSYHFSPLLPLKHANNPMMVFTIASVESTH